MVAAEGREDETAGCCSYGVSQAQIPLGVIFLQLPSNYIILKPMFSG